MQVIVYTRPGGCVSVTIPSHEFMRAACNGGDTRVAVLPIDEWVSRKTAQGHSEDAAYRHARAWWSGGCTSAEAWAIVRDIEPRRIWNERSRIEIITLAPELVCSESVLPSDRYFRDAWRRREDGGNIWIDLEVARDIQRQNMKSALKAWNTQAIEDDERTSLLRPTNGPATIPWNWLGRFKPALLKAVTPEQIRAVWPEDLPRHH